MSTIATPGGVNVGAGLDPPARRHWFRRVARIAWRSLRERMTGFSLSSFRTWSRRAARGVWCGLREWCGDSAYEFYLRSKARQSSGARTLSPTEFYVEQLNRRYSRPNRCC